MRLLGSLGLARGVHTTLALVALTACGPPDGGRPDATAMRDGAVSDRALPGVDALPDAGEPDTGGLDATGLEEGGTDANGTADGGTDAMRDANSDAASPLCEGTACVRLAAGDTHSCARLANGTVRCWGDNAFGKLGDGTTTARPTPVAVTGLRDVVDVAVGTGHSCARMANGEVRCWGENYEGELGTSTPSQSGRPTPATVPGLPAVARLSAAFRATCGVLVAGGTRCWGQMFGGRFGVTGTPTNRMYMVDQPAGVRQIALGPWHACALTAAGEVQCFGGNSSGQLGIGTMDMGGATPRPVPGLVGPVEVAVAPQLFIGFPILYGVSCARTRDGAVFCWGRNSSGQLGDGTMTDRATAARVMDLGPVAQLAVGLSHSCALLGDGGVSCWGRNMEGQLGDGTTTARLRPVRVQALTDATSVVVGSAHSCATRRDGSVVCWGTNRLGQLGNGTMASSPSPVRVQL